MCYRVDEVHCNIFDVFWNKILTRIQLEVRERGGGDGLQIQYKMFMHQLSRDFLQSNYVVIMECFILVEGWSNILGGIQKK
jgi:hypothetical protein